MVHICINCGVFFAISSLLIRAHSKKHEDSLIFSFCFSSIGTIILLPLVVFMQPSLPSDLVFWGGILLISTLIVISNALGFAASKYVGASIQNIVGKLRLVGILLAGIIIFGEAITLNKTIGMILVLGASLIVIDYKKGHSSKKGIILLLSNILFVILSAIILKKVVLMSDYILVTFLIFFIPALINLAVIPNVIERLKKKIPHIKPLILITVLGVIANLALVKALSYKEMSGVYFMMEGAIILVVFGEHFILKEKERLGWKIIAAILAIGGAILLQI